MILSHVIWQYVIWFGYMWLKIPTCESHMWKQEHLCQQQQQQIACLTYKGKDS